MRTQREFTQSYKYFIDTSCFSEFVVFNISMDKDSKKTCDRLARRKVQDLSSTMSEGTSGSGNDVPTRRLKRKATPYITTLRKRLRLSDTDTPSTSEDEVRVRGKRKVREDGEGLIKKRAKKRRLDLLRCDQEVASSSTDTGTESSNIDVKDVRKRGVKRKAGADGEAPTMKKARSQDLEGIREETKGETRENMSAEDLRAEFNAKYREGKKLGAGGCGSVFAGYRKADNLPVAIKHIRKEKVYCKHVDEDGKEVSVEVAIMKKLAAGSSGSTGASAPVSLLDWFDLGQELILVLERPVPATDLQNYIDDNGGCLQEEEAKIILKQLVDAAQELEGQRIFHRDIKVENILIETGSDIPRVRIIDFGLSCFFKDRSTYRVFYGTSAYSPPEWHSRFTYRAGPTTVWQLGAVLYETIHRNASFETRKFLGNSQRISSVLSEDCQDFLRSCLAKNPKRRPTLEELKHHPWLR